MRALITGLLWAASVAALADPIDLQLANGVGVRAEYRQGMADKPALLLQHGFLQTYEFPTIHRLLGALHGAGYTVLAPNLSLGVTHRKQSLACEAIHTHTLGEDTQEIDAWVNWLMKKQRSNGIVLIGHSFGSVHVLAYLAGRPNAPVKKIIGVSIVEARTTLDGPGREKLLRDTQAKVKRGDKQILNHPFSFCQSLRTTPASLASYMEWSPERILKSIDQSPIPVTMIMGSRDDRLGPGWIERLKKGRGTVRMIEGANHFMDGEHEFDLHDIVLAELKKP